MKTKSESRFTSLLLGLALIGLSAALTPPAHADSFQVTNIVNVSVSIVADPTNANNILTGSAIPVPNQKELGFYIKGYNANANASALTVKMIRAGGPGYPVINSTNRDWETASAAALTITATTPAAVGPWYWYTNLNADIIGSAAYVGVLSVTNATASASFTNAEFGLVKKIIPIRYP